MKKTKKKNKFFENLKASLEDVIAHRKGQINLRTTIFEIPEPPAEYTNKQIKKIRATRRYSQGMFAKILNVSIKTVQSWESGQRSPSHAALRLLEIIDKGIYTPFSIETNQRKN